MPVNPSQIRLARLQRRCIAPGRPLLHSPASNAETPPSPGVIEHNCGLHENCARLPASLTCRKYTTQPGCFCNSGSSGLQCRGIPESMKPDNIFADIPDNPEQEILERLAGSGQVTIERIISRGHASPATGWYDQETSEWVIVLRGEARLSFADRTSVHLRAGDYLNLPAHRKHRVDWTAPDRETVWLAVHYRD